MWKNACAHNNKPVRLQTTFCRSSHARLIEHDTAMCAQQKKESPDSQRLPYVDFRKNAAGQHEPQHEVQPDTPATAISFRDRPEPVQVRRTLAGPIFMVESC